MEDILNCNPYICEEGGSDNYDYNYDYDYT